MSHKAGPRVLIATLFLPETVNFDEPPASPAPGFSPGFPQQETEAVPAGTKDLDNSKRSQSVANIGGSGSPIPFPSSSARTLSPIPSALSSPTRARAGDSEAGAAVTFPAAGSLVLPQITSIKQGSGSGSSSRSRPGISRANSILEDLQTRGTGPSGGASPKHTPSDLELGTNPFEAASTAITTPAAVATPASGPSAAKRPAATRLLSESAGTSAALTFSSEVRSRLEKSFDQRQQPLRSILASPRTDNQQNTRASYFPQGQYGNSGQDTPRTRRRSSSAGRHVVTGTTGLSRTFSRASRKNDHRRRSSTIADVNGLAANASIPPFFFEVNPHGNGGLQNAVRSVADVHHRTASEPTASTTPTLSGSAPTRPHIPGTKKAIGEYTWVGTIGCSVGDFDDPLRKVVEKRYKDEKRSAVVWVEDETLEPAYDLFCKQILWPTFHYQVHDAHKSKAYESPSWKDYQAMNQAFADKIVSIYQEGDLIWVNDYHLLLVPQLVREKLPNATIGFFLHIAFPSSEIFRCLAVRRELLNGVLAADLVGFQTYNTARHFRQTCQRLLSVEATPRGIQLQNGFAKVGVFPIGIDVKALHERKKEQEVADWVSTLRERYGDLRILIARDKLDEIKGVRQKLVAYEAFLERYPEWQGKVVLIQVAMATCLENEKQGNVVDLVARINARFSTFTYQPVVFLHQDVNFSQYLALLQVAEIFINSSLREGMNLTSHEYIICQEGQWGPLLLSEFTGSYSRAGFQRCIPINPYDKISFANAINEALCMPEDERISRWRDLERHVWSQTAQHWCNGYLAALGREAIDVKTRPLTSPSIQKSLYSPSDLTATSQTEGFLQPVFDGYKALSGYASAKRRLLLLDLEGTVLEGDSAESSDLDLNSGVFESLRKLASDPKNTVYLLSGKSTRDLDELMKDLPGVGFVAENGCFATLANRTEATADNAWHKLVTGTHNSWRQPVLEILAYYTERTPGSYVEDRGISIVWKYANTGDQIEAITSTARSKRLSTAGMLLDGPAICEDGKGNEAYTWARRQAAEVQNHIMDALGERFGLQLFPGATSFLILPRKAGRAKAVAHILQADEFETGHQSKKVLEDEVVVVDDDVDIEAAGMRAETARMAGRKASVPASTAQSMQLEADREVSGSSASRQLTAQFDYVLSMGEDQRICSWLEELALEKVVTVAVGAKKRESRYRLEGPPQVAEALRVLANGQQ